MIDAEAGKPNALAAAVTRSVLEGQGGAKSMFDWLRRLREANRRAAEDEAWLSRRARARASSEINA